MSGILYRQTQSYYCYITEIQLSNHCLLLLPDYLCIHSQIIVSIIQELSILFLTAFWQLPGCIFGGLSLGIYFFQFLFFFYTITIFGVIIVYSSLYHSGSDYINTVQNNPSFHCTVDVRFGFNRVQLWGLELFSLMSFPHRLHFFSFSRCSMA